MTIDALGLFSGTRTGTDPAFADLATGLGTLVAARGLTLVCGCGGLADLAVRAALAGGGRVVAVVEGSAQPPDDRTVVAANPDERRAGIMARADAVVVLPGGLGTIDALFAAMTSRRRGGHAKPIFVVDCGDSRQFWAPFRDLLGHLDRAGFADPGVFALVEPIGGLDALAARFDRPG